MKIVAFTLAFSIVLVAMCVQHSGMVVKIGSITVNAEVAETPQELEKGLMGRSQLAKDGGMIFVFMDESKRTFWMKNTLIPLDIIFISSDFMIVDIKKNFEPCTSLFFCSTYESKYPAKYVLEVNGNFTNIKGIKIGDTVILI